MVKYVLGGIVFKMADIEDTRQKVFSLFVAGAAKVPNKSRKIFEEQREKKNTKKKIENKLSKHRGLGISLGRVQRDVIITYPNQNILKNNSKHAVAISKISQHIPQKKVKTCPK